MSWDDHNRRRAAIRTVLEYAGKNPAAGLPYDDLPEVRAIFPERRALVLALQYDWSQALWGRIAVLSLGTGRRKAELVDADALAATAWSECAARHPILRRLLDTYRDELGPAVHAA
jgi:hypothetical protein